MRRTALILLLSVLMALPGASPVMASGGAEDNDPTIYTTGKPIIKASIVIDPHNPGVTFDTRGVPSDTVEKSGWASIRMVNKKASSTAIFRIELGSQVSPDNFALYSGCTLTVPNPDPTIYSPPLPAGTDLTAYRFVWRPDRRVKLSWIPWETLKQLIWDVTGIEVVFGQLPEPVITSVENATCTADPQNSGSLLNANNTKPAPGILSFDATIEFLTIK